MCTITNLCGVRRRLWRSCLIALLTTSGCILKNIYETGELRQEATTENFSVVQAEGERQVNRSLKFYNLDAIISVGYRVNSSRATQFRQWCTFILRQFAIRGYVIDKKRMETGRL